MILKDKRYYYNLQDSFVHTYIQYFELIKALILFLDFGKKKSVFHW